MHGCGKLVWDNNLIIDSEVPQYKQLNPEGRQECLKSLDLKPEYNYDITN